MYFYWGITDMKGIAGSAYGLLGIQQSTMCRTLVNTCVGQTHKQLGCQFLSEPLHVQSGTPSSEISILSPP